MTVEGGTTGGWGAGGGSVGPHGGDGPSARDYEAACAMPMPDRGSLEVVRAVVGELSRLDLPDFAYTTDGHNSPEFDGGMPGNADLATLASRVAVPTRATPAGVAFERDASLGEALLQVANGAARALAESNSAYGGADPAELDAPEDFTARQPVRSDEAVRVTVRWDQAFARLSTSAATVDAAGRVVGMDRRWSVERAGGDLVRETAPSAGVAEGADGHVPSAFDAHGERHVGRSADPRRRAEALVARLAAASSDPGKPGSSADGARVATWVRRADLEAAVDGTGNGSATGAYGRGLASTTHTVAQPRWVDGRTRAEGSLELVEGAAGARMLLEGFGDNNFARRLWLDAAGLREHAATERGMADLEALAAGGEERAVELGDERRRRGSERAAARREGATAAR